MEVSDCLELKCDEAVYDYKNDNNAYVTPTSSRSVQVVCGSFVFVVRSSAFTADVDQYRTQQSLLFA